MGKLKNTAFCDWETWADTDDKRLRQGPVSDWLVAMDEPYPEARQERCDSHTGVGDQAAHPAASHTADLQPRPARSGAVCSSAEVAEALVFACNPRTPLAQAREKATWLISKHGKDAPAGARAFVIAMFSMNPRLLTRCADSPAYTSDGEVPPEVAERLRAGAPCSAPERARSDIEYRPI